MGRNYLAGLLAVCLVMLIGCSGGNEPVAEKPKENEAKPTPSTKQNANVGEKKPAKPVTTEPAKKEQKPKPPANSEPKKTENKKPNPGSKGKPTSEDQLLVIINKGIEKNRFDFSLDEELEKRHKDFFPILLKMAADSSMAVPQRAAAIMAIEDLLLIGNDKEKEDRKKKVAAVLAPVLRVSENPPAVRAAAAFILSDKDEYPESVAAWEAGIVQTDLPMVQLLSMNKLPEEPKKKLLPQLIALTRSPNKDLASNAITTVAYLKDTADAAIPVFVELLKDPKHHELDGLLYGLGAIGTRPELTLPVLKTYAEKPDSHGWSHAAKSLTQVLAKNDLDPAPYFPTLKLSLERCSESQRENTLESLETLGPKAAPLIPVVLPYLDDKDKGVQTQAISVLKAMGPAAKPAVEELKKRLAAPDAKHREELVEALRAITPDDPSLPKE
jgi:HEAT repeat protein